MEITIITISASYLNLVNHEEDPGARSASVFEGE